MLCIFPYICRGCRVGYFWHVLLRLCYVKKQKQPRARRQTPSFVFLLQGHRWQELLRVTGYSEEFYYGFKKNCHKLASSFISKEPGNWNFILLSFICPGLSGPTESAMERYFFIPPNTTTTEWAGELSTFENVELWMLYDTFTPNSKALYNVYVSALICTHTLVTCVSHIRISHRWLLTSPLRHPPFTFSLTGLGRFQEHCKALSDYSRFLSSAIFEECSKRNWAWDAVQQCCKSVTLRCKA